MGASHKIGYMLAGLAVGVFTTIAVYKILHPYDDDSSSVDWNTDGDLIYYTSAQQEVPPFPLKVMPGSVEVNETLHDGSGTEARYVLTVNNEEAVRDIRRQFREEGWTADYIDEGYYSSSYLQPDEWDAFYDQYPYMSSDRFVKEGAGTVDVYYLRTAIRSEKSASNQVGPLVLTNTSYSSKEGPLERIEVNVSSYYQGTSAAILSPSRNLIYPYTRADR